MADYLLGNLYQSVGMINGKPVTMKSVIHGYRSNCVVTIDGKQIEFDSRKEALQYLRSHSKRTAADEESNREAYQRNNRQEENS